MKNQNEETKKTPSHEGKIIKAIVLLIIITLLFLILMPRINVTPELAKIVICKSNLKSISMAIRLYAEENNSRVPAHQEWNDLLIPYLQDYKYLRCPIDKTKDEKLSTYVLNKNLKKLRAPIPEDLIIAFEGPTGWNQTGGPEKMIYRHRKNTECNIILGDYSVQSVTEAEAKKLKWKP